MFRNRNRSRRFRSGLYSDWLTKGTPLRSRNCFVAGRNSCCLIVVRELGRNPNWIDISKVKMASQNFVNSWFGYSFKLGARQTAVLFNQALYFLDVGPCRSRNGSPCGLPFRKLKTPLLNICYTAPYSVEWKASILISQRKLSKNLLAWYTHFMAS